ncbi:hypothetical protein [Cellulosimicrobium sp. NPDC057127]|uniref:PASTA domain-containing protein n=1 Tax=Cellulosimicrobium sp. NPDC057127 TaxID=3346026 RepID=UPI0036416D9E
MRRSLFGVFVAAVTAFALSSCGSESPEQVTVTVTEEAVEPAPSPSASEVAPDAATAETEPQAVAEAEAEVEATFEMPSVVGHNLQDAQDLLQTLDSFVMDQVDATGLERLAVNDSNWTVCAQDPVPGTVVPISTVVTLSAVKLDEVCP